MFNVRRLGFRTSRAYDWPVTTGTRLSVVLGASAAAAMLLFLGSATAAPGDLDPTFGDGGVAEPTQGLGTVMALQPDGMILVGGYTFPWELGVARYTPQGRLDRSFGSRGVAVGPSGRATGLAIQPDGKIVATGYLADGSMSVVRFTRAGSLDASFGSGGVVTGPQGDGSAIAVQDNGKIVVVGTSGDPFSSFAAITAFRLQPDGLPDAGFGSNGFVRTPIGLGSVGRDVALQPDGKIVVAGSSDGMTLVRYETDGSLDPSFGSGGIAKSAAPGPSWAESVVLQGDGRILAAGGAGTSMAVARFLLDGRPDPSFGSRGVTTARSGGLGSASDVALQSHGRIVVAASGQDVVALVRVRPDGNLDADFGEEGVSQVALGSRSGASGVAVDPDGRILAAGFSSGETATHFLLAGFRVTSPTTIAAKPFVVRYGSQVEVTGTAVDPRPGAGVQILARGCNAHTTTRAGTTTEQVHGEWRARVTPRARMGYRARILGDRSVSVTVQVRPRVTVRRLPHGHVQVRVLFGRALTGETIALQRLRPAAGWNTVRVTELHRTSRTGDGVLSGATFRAARRGGLLRAVLRQPNAYACYAEAFSRSIPG
jgi:uncharacterized delta-60 repeat protein